MTTTTTQVMSEYEIMRQRNIEENNSVLKDLGLITDSTWSTSKKTSRARVKDTDSEEEKIARPLRRCERLAGVVVTTSYQDPPLSPKEKKTKKKAARIDTGRKVDANRKLSIPLKATKEKRQSTKTPMQYDANSSIESILMQFLPPETFSFTSSPGVPKYFTTGAKHICTGCNRVLVIRNGGMIRRHRDTEGLTCRMSGVHI